MHCLATAQQTMNFSSTTQRKKWKTQLKQWFCSPKCVRLLMFVTPTVLFSLVFLFFFVNSFHLLQQYNSDSFSHSFYSSFFCLILLRNCFVSSEKKNPHYETWQRMHINIKPLKCRSAISDLYLNIACSFNFLLNNIGGDKENLYSIFVVCSFTFFLSINYTFVLCIFTSSLFFLRSRNDVM